jgi:PTH1 family peptidyl-tRNA hydrolase
LGNPGEAYFQNRHNIGFQVVDRIARECGMGFRKPHFLSRYEVAKGSRQGRPIVLVKPLTYMNLSGEIVKGALRQSKAAPEELLIVCDSLDLRLGALKMKLQGSSGGHHGLDSVFNALKTTAVMRLSIGIGRPQGRSHVIGHVLGDPSAEEAAVLDKAVEAAAFHILRLLKEPREKVMGEVNRRVKRDAPEEG